MATSSQLTDFIRDQKNPKESKFDLWDRCRYLVAQRPIDDTIDVSNIQYYLGRRVIPGPKANERFGVLVDVDDLDVIEQQYYIRWTDSNTTANADLHIGQALFTIMTTQEADAYEKSAHRFVDELNMQFLPKGKPKNAITYRQDSGTDCQTA